MTTSGIDEGSSGDNDPGLSPTDREFGAVGDDFIAQADATYSLLQLAYELSDRQFDISSATDGLSAEQQSQVWDRLLAILEEVRDAIDSGQTGTLSIDVGADTEVERAAFRLLMNGAHQVKMPSKKLLVRRSMLLLAVSDFELLMGQVAGLIMKWIPGVANAGDASITLSELEHLGDVRAAKKIVIDRKVDDLLRQNMDSWVGWFDRVGVKWKDMADDWCQFAEIFARRNVVVHAGGKVTAQYIGALSSAGCKASKLPASGTKLELDDQYLTDASEQLLAFGFLLVTGSWLQVAKGNTLSAESWITTRCQHLLELQHFRAVDTACRTILERSRGRLLRKTELLLQTMSWVARRELGDGDRVRVEVAAWDTSGIDLLYGHAKTVLLDDDELAVTQINELRRRQELTIVELVASPLYRAVLDRCRADLLPTGSEEVSLEIANPDSDLEVAPERDSRQGICDGDQRDEPGNAKA